MRHTPLTAAPRADFDTATELIASVSERRVERSIAGVKTASRRSGSVAPFAVQQVIP